MRTPYRNEGSVDFGSEEVRRQLDRALEKWQGELGKEYPLIIGGERIMTEEKITSLNPGNLDQVVGYVAKARKEHIDRAMEVAWDAFEEWKRVPGPARARILYKAAAIMRRRKAEFTALEVLEAGKTWPEADGDVAEAIDFLEFYGRRMEELSGPQPITPMEGVDNELFYIPLGVGAIIPPWNFPLAILTGLTSSALVTGNTALLKPASATPVIGYKFAELMEEAGLPKGVLNFVPGSGGEIGDYMVDHPKTRFITFTGSMDVGTRIYERAAKVQPGQKWLKRVVAEMGGKDAIIVAEDADTTDAAAGIIASAFGFQGQKCSAASRAIIVQDVYDEVVEKVTRLTRQLKVGPAHDWSVDMGPVVDKGAYEKILRYIEIGKEEGRVVAGGGKAEGNGYYIQPTVIVDVDPHARIAQEEIFGPVLAVIKAKDYDHALEIANDTVYGLTGAVYSRDRMKLERARQEFHVGNLYFNRKCTGSLVGVEPFGGYNMSGTGPKAGGRDYLLSFLQAKAVSEKL